MDCWERLGIEPTSEKREIKRAYAKLLKTNKPDQDPEGFKSLNSAYQTALNLAAYIDVDDDYDSNSYSEAFAMAEALDQELKQKLVLSDDFHGSNSLESIAPEANDWNISVDQPPSNEETRDEIEDDTEDDTEDDLASSEVQQEEPHQARTVSGNSDMHDHSMESPSADLETQYVSKASSSLESSSPLSYSQLLLETQWLATSRARNNIKRWQALLREEVLIDWENFEAYSQYLFNYLTSKSLKTNRFPITAQLLRYLNEHFNWANRIDWLESFARDEAIYQFQLRLNELPRLSGFFLPPVKQYRSWQLAPEEGVSGAKFLNGFFLIIIFFITLILLVNYINTSDWPFFRVTFGITLLIAFFMMPCLEGTRLKASPGYLWQGLSLLKSDGKSLTYKDAFLRFLIFGGWPVLSLCSYFVMEYGANSLSYLLSPFWRLSLFLLSVFLLRLIANYLQSKLNIVTVVRSALRE